MPRENTCIFAGMSSRCRARAFTFSAIIKSSAREISGEVRPDGRCESGKAKSEWWKRYASSVDRERLLERRWTASIRIGRRVGGIQFARRFDRSRAPLSSRITRRLRLRNSSWMTGVQPLSEYKESIERGLNKWWISLTTRSDEKANLLLLSLDVVERIQEQCERKSEGERKEREKWEELTMKRRTISERITRSVHGRGGSDLPGDHYSRNYPRWNGNASDTGF